MNPCDELYMCPDCKEWSSHAENCCNTFSAFECTQCTEDQYRIGRENQASSEGENV